MAQNEQDVLLQYGSKGDDVKALQTTLNGLGYSLDVDGAYGPATQAAVKDYQSKNNLTVDGIAGSQTFAALNTGTAAPTTPAPPAAPATPATQGSNPTAASAPAATTAPAKVDANYMSPTDLARVDYYTQMYNSTDDPVVKQAAHEAAEDIREKYGYSGGVDGSQYITEGVYQSAGNHHDEGLPKESQAVIDSARLQYYICQANGDTNGMEYWHGVAEAERAKYGYSGGADGSEHIAAKKPEAVTNTVIPGVSTPDAIAGVKVPSAITGVTAPSVVGGVKAPTAIAGVTAPNTIAGVTAPNTIAGVTAPNMVGGTNVEGVTATMPEATGADLLAKWKEEVVPKVDADAMAEQWKADAPDVDAAKNAQLSSLEKWKNDMLEQSNGRIDYNVAKAVTELERALADSQGQFKEQQESVAKDETQARDNAALYAEVRGDKGGIGQEQYSSIANTAAQNRLAIQQAQTKLSTDTQRQIADLRAQGEFEKADAALEISQQYLSQLMNLEQWAFDAGLTSAQFKASLDQWAADYKMAIAQFTTGLDQWAADYDFNLAQYKTGADQWNAQFQLGQEQWNKDFALDQQKFQTETDKWNKDFEFAQQQEQTNLDKWNKDFAFSQQQEQTALDKWNKDFALDQQKFQTETDMWNKDFEVGQKQFNTETDMWNKDFEFAQQKENTDVEQWNKDFEFAQQQEKTDVEQWNKNFEYGQQMDDAAYLQWFQEHEYKKDKDEADRQAGAAEILINAGVDNLSAEQLKALGLDPEQAAALIAALKEAQKKDNGASTDGADYVSGYQKAYDAGIRTYEDAFEFFTSKEGGSHPDTEAEQIAKYYVDKWDKNKTGFLNLTDLNYDTIVKNSEAGLYGPAFGLSLGMVQSMWSSNKNNEEIAAYLEKQLDDGAINEYGVAVIMQALGM